MSQNNTFNRLKKSSTVFFGLILGLLVSSDVLAECALAESYKLPNGVVFDEHCEFDGELAPVIKGSKYGFIDKQGVTKIPTQYDLPIAFVEGLASVHKDNLSGYINMQGEVIIPLKYSLTYPFEDGLAVVGVDNRRGVIDK